MSSHAQDSSTQKQASAGATQQDQVLAQNAQQNQNFANNTRTSLFGNYSGGKYAGGSMSPYLDPNSMNKSGLSGSYLNNYNNASNHIAEQGRNAVQTSQQNMANRGMGHSPAGFAADQERKAYQDQAGQQGDLYGAASTAQHGEDVSNYWNATNMLNSNASQTANLSLAGNQAAAGNYSSLYGTASQQQQSPWGAVLGAAAGVGAAYAGKPGCWVAAELFGGWGDPRTITVREWIFGPFQEKAIGRMLGKLYIRFGERVAERIKTDRVLRAVMQTIFNRALKAATEAR